MAIKAIWREYNPTSGVLLGTVSDFNFGKVLVGEISPIRVFDIVVPDASIISNFRIEITSSDLIVVNPSPIDIGSDGSSGNGNFGIETSSSFVNKNVLTRFFPGINMPVLVGTRFNNVTNFIYLNSKMVTSSSVSGSFTYTISADYS